MASSYREGLAYAYMRAFREAARALAMTTAAKVSRFTKAVALTGRGSRDMRCSPAN
jgi:hypothetical protein